MELSIVTNKLVPQEMFYRCCASLTLIWRAIYGLVILYTVLYLSSLVSVMDIFDDWRDARRQQTPLMYCVRQSGDIHIKKTPQRNSGSLFFVTVWTSADLNIFIYSANLSGTFLHFYRGILQSCSSRNMFFLPLQKIL